MNHFQRSFVSLIGFALGVIALVGVYFIVRAVAPGVIPSPVFGPTDDDVVVTVSWDPATCYDTAWSCSPQCPPGEIMVGVKVPRTYNDVCFDNGSDMDQSQLSARCCKI